MLAVRRLSAVAVATAIAAIASVPAAAPPADAASAVRFSYVQYNSPGSDTGGNTSLNGEYIKIKNYGTASKNLTGWSVRDVANHVYTFGKFTLKPGATVTLYTGKGTNTASKRYWGQTWYIWNNDGDTAKLRNASGTTVASCKWGSSGSAKNC
ncbi:lamin tail domain-containing protein [Demequina phytophila]|uniref:lamin tail domain-containing protein n=1 Tax=Demequina phytophila TaxID=1638981 RepID=UPI0007804EE5|nr:lamin tail domain-containing protein [Demequina phytophila]